MSPAAGLPRLWPTIGLPGIGASPFATYSWLELDQMPPVQAEMDGSLEWLINHPVVEGSLGEAGPHDPEPARFADRAGLVAVAGGVAVPRSFERFTTDLELRRRVRSATACYLDLAQFGTPYGDGTLIHFLSDQQWVLHWLLWVGPDNRETVVVTPNAIGFDLDDGSPRSPNPDGLAVCGDSFEEFLYRFWAMNELFYRRVVDEASIDDLPAGLAAFARAYPHVPGGSDT